MKISLTANEELFHVQYEGIKELGKLAKFPGLLKINHQYYIPAKPRLVRNLITRLRQSFPNLLVTKDVNRFYANSTSLLEIPEDFKFYTKPLPHQLLALRFGYTNRNLGLLLEPGLGKTKVILDWIYLLQGFPACIVCPLPLTFVWEDEAIKHRPEVVPYVFKSTDFAKEFAKAKEKGANTLVINYDKAVTLEPFLSKSNIKTLAIDEGLIKNATTARTQSILKMSRNMKKLENRAIMSGTLISNGVADAFCPIQFLEPSLVGTSYGDFAAEFLGKTSVKKPDGTWGTAFTKSSNSPESEQAVRDILEACSIVMTKKAWLDLPEKTVKDVMVDLPDEWTRCMDDLVSNYTVTLPDGQVVECEIPLSILCKWAQLGRGFCYIPDVEFEGDSIDALFGMEESGKKKKKKVSSVKEIYLFEGENPFIQKTISLLKEELVEEKCILWFNLKTEGMLLEQALQEAEISYETIFGGEKYIKSKVDGFNRDANCQVLLCQARVINYGVTVLGRESDTETDVEIMPDFNTRVCNEIFFSCNYSYELYTQQQDRIHRIGQTRACTYWRLWGKGEYLDLAIRTALDSKQSLNKRMLVDILENRKEELTNDY